MESVYHAENRSQVVQFLTRQFGFESAVEMINSRTVPESAKVVITQKVIPRPIKPVVLKWDDETVKQDFVRYIARTYPNKTVEFHELSDYDKRMIHTMNRMRSLYHSYNRDRKKTLLTNIREIEQTSQKVHDTSSKKGSMSSKKESMSSVKPLKKCDQSIICRAVKMNGEKCTAKAKNGIEYCCRHSKK
jgi:hypothetical protein